LKSQKKKDEGIWIVLIDKYKKVKK
jgi:hypothetical protein